MYLLLFWPFISLALGIFLTLKLCRFILPSRQEDTVPWKSVMSDSRLWMHAALPLYLFHQFEEHGYDVFGRRYSFQGYFCYKLVRNL
jgi:hypothetical protein